MTTTTMQNSLSADFETKVKAINALYLAKAPSSTIDAELVKLKQIEKDYLTVLEKQVFRGLDTAYDALIKFTFDTISHKRVSENGVVTGIEATTKTVQVDLKKFCEYKDLSLDWYYEMQAFNRRLTLRAMLELKVPVKQIEELADCYYMHELARKIELGETPTSNTQCVKHMQKILDMLAPDGERLGHLDNCDLNYILATYTKRSKKELLTVITARHSELQTSLTDAFHRIITNKLYNVSYKRNKSKVTETTATETTETTATETTKA